MRSDRVKLRLDRSILEIGLSGGGVFEKQFFETIDLVVRDLSVTPRSEETD